MEITTGFYGFRTELLLEIIFISRGNVRKNGRFPRLIILIGIFYNIRRERRCELIYTN